MEGIGGMGDRSAHADIASDESLVLLARAGDRSAFAELWQRHARSGLRVARQFTSSIDADDLVSEAYARIYQRVLAGGGPDGAFRPYLYTTIRNLASRWGQNRRDVNVDDIGELEDPAAPDDPVTVALDRTLTVRAFRSLPERWQSVLWYTEIEGMDPHEVAPILGISANGVAALSYRAREGLRTAWLQAHISDETSSGECRWSIARLGDYARGGLTARERTRVGDHLATCARCAIISEEVDEVGSRLAVVMIPLLLGGVAGGALLASLGTPSSAVAASVTPSVVSALGSGGAVAPPTIAAGLAATGISAPLIATLAVAMVFSGGLAATHSVVDASAPATISVTAPPEGGPTGSGAPNGAIVPTTAPATAQTVGPIDSAIGQVTTTIGQVTTTIGQVTTGLVDPATGVVKTATGILSPVADVVGATVPVAVGGDVATVSGLVTGLGAQ